MLATAFWSLVVVLAPRLSLAEGEGGKSIQVEWRMSMLCEQSGFINEALDFLVSVERRNAAALAEDSSQSANSPPLLDVALTGLHGDCRGLSETMSPAHADTLLRLRAIDQGVPRLGETGSVEGYADGETGGVQHSSCMLSYIEEEGAYGYLCDRHMSGEDGAALPRKVTLQSKRVAVEHGFACAVRKRGKFNRTVFETNFGSRPDVVVARCMSESSEISAKEKKCLAEAGADELWVPTKWHAEIYRAASVGIMDPERIVVVPEIVDVDFFARSMVPPPPPPPQPDQQKQQGDKAPFVFFSVFKWEWRKGWDVLLLAYWKAFYGKGDAPRNDVLLRIKTFRPQVGLLKGVFAESSNGDTVDEEISAFAEGLMGEPRSQLPPVEVITEFITREQLRDMYADADVFVLPTRGEGWGLPIVEAMAMELPVIVTNYSGPTEYLTEENSFPLRLDGIDRGFAMPSVKALIESMRLCADQPELAKAKGQQAVVDMRAKYSSEVLGKAITARLEYLAQSLESTGDLTIPGAALPQS